MAVYNLQRASPRVYSSDEVTHVTNLCRIASATFLATCCVTALSAQTANAAARTVHTRNFTVAWNTGVDTEAITTLEWKGGANLTGMYQLNQCGNNDVVYFGNGFTPPDPEFGGLVLVGGGTTTPPGTIPWAYQAGSGFGQVTVNSSSTTCEPASTGVDVQTVYRFIGPGDTGVNWFQVQRVFDFSARPFTYELRPYISRLNISAGYSDVIYPAPSHTLIDDNAYNCGFGCTGPVGAPDAAPLSPPLDSVADWFAIHNSATGQGVVVSRFQSTDPQGKVITPQLWVDYDGSIPATNSSTFLLLPPPGGFSGGLVTEVETLCFYDSTIWTPSLAPPLGCRVDHFVLSPWTLTFGARTVGSTSATLRTSLTNVGPGAVKIARIVADGDFTQINDCPSALPVSGSCSIGVTFTPSGAGIRSGSVSINSLLPSSPQVLSLAGLGVAAN